MTGAPGLEADAAALPSRPAKGAFPASPQRAVPRTPKSALQDDAGSLASVRTTSSQDSSSTYRMMAQLYRDQVKRASYDREPPAKTFRPESSACRLPDAVEVARHADDAPAGVRTVRLNLHHHICPTLRADEKAARRNDIAEMAARSLSPSSRGGAESPSGVRWPPMHFLPDAVEDSDPEAEEDDPRVFTCFAKENNFQGLLTSDWTECLGDRRTRDDIIQPKLDPGAEGAWAGQRSQHWRGALPEGMFRGGGAIRAEELLFYRSQTTRDRARLSRSCPPATKRHPVTQAAAGAVARRTPFVRLGDAKWSPAWPPSSAARRAEERQMRRRREENETLTEEAIKQFYTRGKQCSPDGGIDTPSEVFLSGPHEKWQFDFHHVGRSEEQAPRSDAVSPGVGDDGSWTIQDKLYQEKAKNRQMAVERIAKQGISYGGEERQVGCLDSKKEAFDRSLPRNPEPLL
eukprot:TRINITY_DN11219_c0_g1_i2.p1 TRINITY_DN11219_c0_g1~~TRINITY_DN11219_c0_g1_i2.p1  ORF type:complete len:460 (-),score=100.78 TRINITY_DN11219_c0_g1_i2:184-1563(-)